MSATRSSNRFAALTTRWMLGAVLWIAAFSGAAEAQTITRGPYLMIGTSSSVMVRWQTSASTSGRVYYGTNPWNLTTFVDDPAAGIDHAITLPGLAPDTRYFYTVGTTSAKLASGLKYKFLTSPLTGTSKPTRVWVLGDAGTGNVNAMAVRDAYLTFNGARETDLLLFLGDNAYAVGAEAEYQANHFDIFANSLRDTISWYTLGNHETYTGAVGAHPYFSLFNFPTTAQAGGMPSGTKSYFSFDYGNMHFISLDSMETNRAVGGTMYNWLLADLQANTKPWLIAYWHHPAYTKGTHDSDTEIELIEMRQNMLPLLEQYGVDLVLAGHSHVYERSYLINGHYGNGNTFAAAMKLAAGSGRPADAGGAYTKPTMGVQPNKGTVYITAGSSGQAGPFSGAPLPAMFVSMSNLGSMVLDFNGNRLDASFVRENGTVADSFSLIKGTSAGNIPPTVSIATPTTGGVVLSTTGTTNLTATAADSNGIASVTFYADGAQVGNSTVAPFTTAWTNPTPGFHRLTAQAQDAAGAIHTSAPVFVSVATPFDIDANGKVDALTDGLLALRYMFGLRSAGLTTNAMGEGAFRGAAQIETYIAAAPAAFDIDNNGQVDALTDGLILLRYMFGLRNPALTANAIGNNAGRTSVQIQTYLQGLIP